MAESCPKNASEVSGNCEEVVITIPTLPDDIAPIDIPTVKNVTTETLDGTGVFDVYMRAGLAQLMSQYEKNRIKGSDFTTAYIAMVELMMTEANKFVLGLVQAEIAVAMFPVQYMGAAYDALAKEATAKKIKHEADLICQQVVELKANGASKRSLEASQKAVACEQITLYSAQAKGFADKNRNDTFKTVMNAWAIDAVEVRASPNPPEYLSGGNVDETIKSAKSQAGLA